MKGRFFEPYRDNVPLRIASGRNVEAAACRTAQILFSGEYGGYFKPDEHYIELKKDFSNMDEVLRKFRDRTFMDRIVQNAFEMVLLNFTYDVLLDRLHRELAKVLNPVAA